MTARLEDLARRYSAAWVSFHVNQHHADDATHPAHNDRLTAAEDALLDAALAFCGVLPDTKEPAK